MRMVVDTVSAARATSPSEARTSKWSGFCRVSFAAEKEVSAHIIAIPKVDSLLKHFFQGGSCVQWTGHEPSQLSRITHGSSFSYISSFIMPPEAGMNTKSDVPVPEGTIDWPTARNTFFVAFLRFMVSSARSANVRLD